MTRIRCESWLGGRRKYQVEVDVRVGDRKRRTVEPPARFVANSLVTDPPKEDAAFARTLEEGLVRLMAFHREISYDRNWSKWGARLSRVATLLGNYRRVDARGRARAL